MRKQLLFLALLVLLSGCVKCTIGNRKCLESMLSMAQNKVWSCWVVLLCWAQWGVCMFTLTSTAMLAVNISCVYSCVFISSFLQATTGLHGSSHSNQSKISCLQANWQDCCSCWFRQVKWHTLKQTLTFHVS